MNRIDRRSLWRASWPSLVKLAEFHGLEVDPGPETWRRRHVLVEALVRAMDQVGASAPGGDK